MLRYVWACRNILQHPEQQRRRGPGSPPADAPARPCCSPLAPLGGRSWRGATSGVRGCPGKLHRSMTKNGPINGAVFCHTRCVACCSSPYGSKRGVSFQISLWPISPFARSRSWKGKGQDRVCPTLRVCISIFGTPKSPLNWGITSSVACSRFAAFCRKSMLTWDNDVRRTIAGFAAILRRSRYSAAGLQHLGKYQVTKLPNSACCNIAAFISKQAIQPRMGETVPI